MKCSLQHWKITQSFSSIFFSSILNRIRNFEKSLFSVSNGLSFPFIPEISYMGLSIFTFLGSIHLDLFVVVSTVVSCSLIWYQNGYSEMNQFSLNPSFWGYPGWCWYLSRSSITKSHFHFYGISCSFQSAFTGIMTFPLRDGEVRWNSYGKNAHGRAKQWTFQSHLHSLFISCVPLGKFFSINSTKWSHSFLPTSYAVMKTRDVPEAHLCSTALKQGPLKSKLFRFGP